MTEWPGDAVLVLAMLWLYFGFLVRIFDEWAVRALSARFPSSRWSPMEQAAVIEIAVAGAAQIATVGLLVTVLDLDVSAGVFAENPTPTRAVLAPLLGISQAGAAMFVCMTIASVLRATGAVDYAGGGRSPALVSSGWVGSFARIRRAGGLSATIVTATYIVTEEVLFRGVVLATFARTSESLALFGSTALFVLAQASGMPSVRHALFPMASAAVVGLSNAYLVLQGVDLVTVTIAHLTLFFALGSVRREAPRELERSRV